MTEKRFDWDMNGIFDYENDDEDYISEYEDLSDLLNEQDETIQNQKKYILLLKRKLEEYGIRLEPKDYD